MKSAGSDREYWNSKKNHWRRTIWNEILSRTDGKEKTQPVLYLAGPGDYDRKVATDKGVPTQNLIAIDREAANASKVRESGQPSIHAHAYDALANWPVQRPVAAVFLDFCGGLTRDNINTVLCCSSRECFTHSVIAVNLLRGRDQYSNLWRTTVSECEEIRQVVGARLDLKHRGYHLSLIIVDALIKRLPEWLVDKYPEDIPRDIARWMNAKLMTYKSGALVYDSVVFTSPFTYPDCRKVFLRDDNVWDDDRDQALKRKIAAMLAVRTMRMAQ